MSGISIVICTYNRAKYLSKALESIISQKLPDIELEVVIVDNNCTDNTSQIVASFSNKGLDIKYIKEPKQGLSYSRNTGYKSSKHAIIAYLDDDAVATTNWVSHIIRHFSDPKKNVIVGGKIDVIWEYPRPDWLGENLLGWLGYLDLGQDKILDFPLEHVNGGNMAINKSLLEKIGGFNIHLGIQGKKMFTNEEIELQQRAVKENATIYYDSGMEILHHARLNVTPEWFMERSYRHGISVSRSEDSKNGNILNSFFELMIIYKNMLKLSIKKQLGKVGLKTYASEMVSHSYLRGKINGTLSSYFSR